jgi:DNA invertase Pin-like site-specific DNA recombinase
MSMNQSERIRSLASKGLTNSQIQKKLGIRYQTVWRTLNRPYKGVIPQQEMEKKGIRTKETPIIENKFGEGVVQY